MRLRLINPFNRLMSLANIKDTAAGMKAGGGIVQVLGTFQHDPSSGKGDGILGAGRPFGRASLKPRRVRVARCIGIHVGGYPLRASRKTGGSASVKSTTSSPVAVLMSWCRLTTLVPVIS